MNFETGMSKLSLDKFVQLLERSALVDNDRLLQVVSDWKRQATLRQLDDALPCADHLVDVGLLTHWQSKKLLEGRHRGFFLGKYKLLDHLGSGGMSSVYLAEHVLMQRRVAIKVLPQNRVSDSSYLARFHLEAQAAAALDHRNIVRAYDLDNEGKIHYLVMEYVEGQDLHALVCQNGPLDYHTAANYIAQAASGLEHAHQCGLVHRDIKPANLLVDLKGTVKILDMGLAKFTAETRPAPGFAKEEHVLGTADYLAPEQAVNSQTVDARADIYALGCTLYFLLTGHPPFAEGTSLERMTAHQQQLPPSVLLDRPDAPAALVTICRRMMEKSPQSRYQSATEVQRAIGEWLQSEAACGRVSPMVVTAARPSGHDLSDSRHRGPSKANLVSGSAADLHTLPPDSPQFPNGLQDTDPNLQRATVKIPSPAWRHPGDASHAPPPESEVLSSGAAAPRGSDAISGLAHSLPPPVVAPPLAPPISPPPGSQIATWGPPAQLSRAPANSSSDDGAPVDLPLEIDATVAWAPRAGRRIRTSSWPWIIALGALLLIALLLVIAAL